MYRKPGEATFSAGGSELEAILKSCPETQVARIGKNILVSTGHFLKYGDTVFEIAESPEETSEQESLAQKILEPVITTEAMVEGVEARLGIAKAECVYGMNIVKDIFAGARDMFGGRSATIEKGLHDALEAVIEELKKETVKRGANAVIGVQYSQSNLSGTGTSMIMASAIGTAVKLKSS